MRRESGRRMERDKTIKLKEIWAMKEQDEENGQGKE